MAKFSANDGSEYEIRIDTFVLDRLKTDTGIDLLEMLDGKESTCSKALQHPVQLVQLVYHLIESQIEATPEEWAATMTGEALPRAQEAIYQAMIDFLPDDQKKILAFAVDAAREQMKTVSVKVAEMVNDPKMKEKIQNEIARQLGN